MVIKNQLHERPSYTFIELLVVIAIIGILALIGIVQINWYQERARNAMRYFGVERIKTAMERYYQAHGHYPYPTLPDGCNKCALNRDAPINGDPQYAINCRVQFDNSWIGLQQMLGPYISNMPNDPLDVSDKGAIENRNQKFHWHVIVSSPDDNNQHYIIEAGMEGSGSSTYFNKTDAITGNVVRQSVWAWQGDTYGSITWHSDDNEASTAGGGGLTCWQNPNAYPLNGATLYCGKINFTSHGGEDYDSGTYYNLCVGNIFKLPSNPVPTTDVNQWCGLNGWFEDRGPGDCPG